jgi:tight adherence protein B
VGLGLPLDRALTNLVRRMESDDLDLIVTAINIQHEVGGNLAMILETISSTIRERMRIHREIKSITAQQRLTGYVLAFMPFALAGVLFVINPTYMARLFQPGPMLCIPIGAVLLVVLGFLVIRKIVSIEV